ncbi:MAG: carboxypeptidase-like regulatory domain-containing protein, partial [Lutibacter sp.]|nr:carboxypeptidase-like regulatory domain-containing protein [Lutibacter sp.]
MMTKKYIFLSFMFTLVFFSGFSQVKISGVVKDENKQSIPFANIVFVGSSTGTVSDENGKFYLESNKTYTHIEVSFLGYENKTIPVKSRDYNLTIVLKEAAAQLDQVFIYSGKVKKK